MRGFVWIFVLGCGSDLDSLGWRQNIGAPSDAAVEVGPDGTQVDPKARACTPNFTGTVRDFRDTHPDFEKLVGVDRGVVLGMLGADDKPVYASATTTPTTTGAANFDVWYRDTPGVNFALPFTLPVTQTSDGTLVFESASFFPIDGAGFGDEGRAHNFHFTFELHTRFVYRGGEELTFTGDDDLWVFVNRQLAIDLGGAHPPERATIDLDGLAPSFNLARGGTYDLALFHAERHTDGSTFRLQTTFGFVDCP